MGSSEHCCYERSYGTGIYWVILYIPIMKLRQDPKLVSLVLTEMASTRPKLKQYIKGRVAAPSPNRAGGWEYKTISYSFR
jgi:hypothetical protein